MGPRGQASRQVQDKSRQDHFPESPDPPRQAGGSGSVARDLPRPSMTVGVVLSRYQPQRASVAGPVPPGPRLDGPEGPAIAHERGAQSERQTSRPTSRRDSVFIHVPSDIYLQQGGLVFIHVPSDIVPPPPHTHTRRLHGTQKAGPRACRPRRRVRSEKIRQHATKNPQEIGGGWRVCLRP